MTKDCWIARINGCHSAGGTAYAIANAQAFRRCIGRSPVRGGQAEVLGGRLRQCGLMTLFRSGQAVPDCCYPPEYSRAMALRQGKAVRNPALDLMAAWPLFDSPARAAFRPAMNPDPAAWLRARAFAFGKAVAAIPHYRSPDIGFRAARKGKPARVLADPPE